MLWRNVLKSGLQSGAIMGLADLFTQKVVVAMDNNNEIDQWDVSRSCRWIIAGLFLHGPYFFLGFRAIDRYFVDVTTTTQVNMTTVLKKTAAAQFGLFPPYLVLLFSYMGFMEQQNIVEKVKHRVPEAFVAGCIFWPVANVANFALIPSRYRVPYLSFAAGVWNSFLSWDNARQQNPRASH
jgi:hypothetical protein